MALMLELALLHRLRPRQCQQAVVRMCRHGPIEAATVATGTQGTTPSTAVVCRQASST